MAEMNIKTVLEELKNVELHDWELKDLFHRAIKDNVKGEYGLYVTDKELIESDTIENSVKETIEGIKKKYDTIENAILCHEWKSFHNRIKLIERSDKETKFYVWEHGLKEFVSMLRYAINGVFDKDSSETNIYMDLNGITYSTDRGTFIIDGVSFKVFKNHNVIVKGLTDEQYERISKGYENYKKYSKDV